MPRPAVYSKGIGQDDHRTLDNPPKVTSIIELDLTLDDADTDVTNVEEKFQNNTETFFKCIHCSETFSSLEEHVCLAKEAKMFFKCNICEKTFTQYGPFVRHKKTHEDPKGFTDGSSSADTTTEYKICGSTVTVDLRKESGDISQMTNNFDLKEATEGSRMVSLATSSFQSESERISSTTLQLKEEKENQNDVIIIEEDPVRLCSSTDVSENRAIVGKTIEKNLTIYNLPNTDQIDHVRAGNVARSSNFAASDRNKPQGEALSLETRAKPGIETGDGFRQVNTKKTLQQSGKKVRPYMCLFCPRRFSTSSNTREHMRTHTGEKPFSCHVCHKKFAQSSTRSKHLLIHKYHKSPDLTSHVKEAPEKQYHKTGNNPEKSFLLDKFADFKEIPRMNPTKSLTMKVPGTKSYLNLTNHKLWRQPLKRHAFKMPVESASNVSFPSKIAGNRIVSLNAKPSWRNGINKNNNFGYPNDEYKNKINVSHSKVDDVRISDNYPNVRTKTSLSPTTVYSTGSTRSTLGLSVGNPKTKINYLPAVSTPNIATASLLPRPVSRCANRLLRNARTYRPFRCTYCPRTFSTSGNMKEHVRTHTGEKPFQCEYCHRRFAQSSTHSKHVLIHIRKQQLNCYFCGKFFSQVALLRDHIISDHNTVNEDYSRHIRADNRLPSRSMENNKTRDGLSLSLEVPSESFARSENRNTSFREEMFKRNETTADAKPDAKKSTSVSTKKKFLEIDLSTNPVDHLIQEQYKSGQSFQENDERNDRKRDPTETGKTVGQELQENVDSVIATHSFMSESNLPGNLTEGTSVIGQLESEIFGDLLPKVEWSSTATIGPLQHQPLNGMRSCTHPVFEAASIESKNFEFSSVNESEPMTYLAKDGQLIVNVETLDNPFFADDFSARTSFAVEDEQSSNNRTHLGGPKIDNEFRMDYKQFFNLSDDKEAVSNRTSGDQQKPIRLAPSPAQNKTCDNNLISYYRTLSNSGVELQFKMIADEEYEPNKSIIYDRLKSYQLNVPSQFRDSSSSVSYFISPVPTNDTPINCLPLKVEVDERNKNGTDASYSLTNTQNDKYLNFSRVTDRERSTSDIGSRTSFELASRQTETSVDLNHDLSDHKVTRQNSSALLDSEPSLNSCNGDFSKSFTWLSDVEPKSESEREEPTSASTESGVSKILASKTDNSIREESVLLLRNIKLEPKDHHKSRSKHVESTTDSSLAQGTTIDDSFGSGSHLKISEVAANVPYPIMDGVEENESSTHGSGQFCGNVDRFDPELLENIRLKTENNNFDRKHIVGKISSTLSTSDASSSSSSRLAPRLHSSFHPHPSTEAITATAAAAYTKLSKSHSSESISACRSNENEQLRLSDRLPNIVGGISKALLGRKQKDLPSRVTAGKFQCTFCSRSFSSRSNMNEHTRIHTGEKPFECFFCSRRFAQSSTHSKHVQTHLRFKQLVCPRCGKRFLQTNNLWQHIRSQHKTSSAAKTTAPHSDPSSPTAQKSSDRTRQSSGNNKNQLNSETTISVPNVSIDLSEDLPMMANELRSVKAGNSCLVNSDSVQSKQATNRNVPLVKKNYSNLSETNLCRQISSSGNCATKQVPPHSNSLTTEKLSCQTKHSSSNDAETQLAGFIKNNETTFSVPNVSIKLSEDPPAMTSQLISVKAENNSLVNIDTKQSNQATDRTKNNLNRSDINFETTQLNQSNLPLNNISETSSSETNNEISVCKSIQTIDAKINLRNPSSDTFDKQSSDDGIYTKGTFSELDTVCNYEDKNISETSESLPTPASLPFTEISGNDDSCGTRSSALGSKCEICTEVIHSEKLLDTHQRHHFARLAEQRGFDPKPFAIGDLTSLRHFLKENEIRSYDDLEKSFEKIVSVFKLREDLLSPIAVEMPVVRPITNKELPEKNSFDREHIIGKISSMLPLSDASSSSTSSSSRLTPCLHSSRNPTLHPTPIPPVCPEQTDNKSLLCFHRCLFCSKMFSSNADILKHLRNAVEDEENKMASVRSTSNRKNKEYIAWYKHIAIVLGVKLRVPNQTGVKNIQHLIITFDVEERLQTLLHRRGLYKCSQCRREYATFRSLFFHRGNHVKRLTSRISTQRIHLPKRFLRKQSIIFMFLGMDRISLNKENNCNAIGKHVECPRISLPLLCFSLKDHFWLMHHKGRLKAVRSDFRTLSNDKHVPTIEIGSGAVASQLVKHQKSSLEKATEIPGSSNQGIDEEKLEWPLHLFLDSVKDNADIDLVDDELNQKDDAQRKLDFQSSDVRNLGLIKIFGQEVTAMVSFNLQKCVDCRKLFTNISCFRKHLQFHAGRLPVRCSFCPKSFTNFGAFFRHKILIHFDKNCESFKNKESQINAGCESIGWRTDVGSKFDNTRTESESGMNLAAVDTLHGSDLVNKVGSRKSADISTFGPKSSSEDPKITLGMVDNPPRLSDRLVTRIGSQKPSEPFGLNENKLNDGVLESAAGIKIVENESFNDATQDALSTVSDEDCVYVPSSSEPVCKNDMSVERNSNDAFGQNWSRQENDENKSTLAKQPICQAESHFDLNPEFNKEPSINANAGILDSNLKEDGLLDCIFINDDDVLGEASDSSDRNEKTDVADEIIILSDEEIDDDSAKEFSDKNSLITLCDDAEALFVRPEQRQQVSHPKADGKVSQDFCESLGTDSANTKANCVAESDESQNVQIILSTSLSSQDFSKAAAAANSSTMVNLENALYWLETRPSFKKYRCLYCTKTCSNTSNLKEHMRRHTGERPFSCVICHKTFAQKSTLSKHTQIHTRFKMLSSSAVHNSTSDSGTRPIKQIPIRPSFDSVDSLDEQLKSKRTSNVDTNPKTSAFPPVAEWDARVINPDLSNIRKLDDLKPIIDVENDCLRVTRSSEMVSTSLSSPYYTLSSDKSTTDREIRMIDIDDSNDVINQTHGDLEPKIKIENADIKDMQSTPLSSYYVAWSFHNDRFLQNSARFSPCKTVPAKSNSPQLHASNVVAKTGTFEKPYSCDVCSRMFSTAGNLKEHRRTHTGERPFECPFCEKTFVQASTRSRHVKNHSIRFAK